MTDTMQFHPHLRFDGCINRNRRSRDREQKELPAQHQPAIPIWLPVQCLQHRVPRLCGSFRWYLRHAASNLLLLWMYVKIQTKLTWTIRTLTFTASAQASTSTNFKGPTNGDYAISDEIPFTSEIWSPCGAALPLNINSQVRLTSQKAGASGLLTQDSIDGKVTYVVGVQWQKCTP